MDESVRRKIFKDKEETILDVIALLIKFFDLKNCLKLNKKFKLFKHVFHPDIGESLSFIGFLQPTSGGLLTSKIFTFFNTIHSRSISHRDILGIDHEKSSLCDVLLYYFCYHWYI